MSKIILTTIIVICSIATGYRRAGFALEKGKNELEVSPKQLALLKADPRLSVQENTTRTSSASQTKTQKLDNDSMGNGLDSTELDLSKVPPEITCWVSAIHYQQNKSPSSAKPKCDDLEMVVSDGGEEVTTKPSAKERDAAWAWYQQNVVKNVAEA